MADKYEHLIKPLSIGLIHWDDAAMVNGPGNASKEVRLNGRDHLEGMNLNFSWGVHTSLGDWHAGLDPHVHPYPEVLLFVGLDTANINYLGAEVDCCLGEEQEIHAFNEPTAIIVPAGVPHGPIITKRMYSPRGFGFWAIELNSLTDITWLGDAVSKLSPEQRHSAPEGLHFAEPVNIPRHKPVPASGKYAHLVKSLKSYILVERGKWNPSRFTSEQLAQQAKKSKTNGEKSGPGYPDHMVWMNGKELEGLNASIFWGFSSQAGIWRRGAGAHIHPTDEILIYVGTDPNDISYLGAEIEVDLGAEHERHLINRPSIVLCPAGFPHMPQVTRWVDKPFAFFAISLSGEHETKAFD
jgi:uncharacterized RmlC-like cupin family protein